jgi:hypothetical protein
MIKLDLNKIGIKVSYLLKILIIALFFVSIFRSNWIWVFGCILALVVSLVPSILKRNYKIHLPVVLELLITVALLLHIGGGILEGYSGVPGYDVITHFVSSFLVAFLAFVIIYILDKYWDGLMMDKYAMAFVVVLCTVAMGVIWEFNEWMTDVIFGTNEQWGYDDTIKDLFIDSLAGIAMAIIGVQMIKQGRFEDMTDDLGKQIHKIIVERTKEEDDS